MFQDVNLHLESIRGQGDTISKQSESKYMHYKYNYKDL